MPLKKKQFNATTLKKCNEEKIKLEKRLQEMEASADVNQKTQVVLLRKLGGVFLKLGTEENLRSALGHIQRALEMQKKADPKDVKIAITLEMLARVHEALAQKKEEIECLHEALAIIVNKVVSAGLDSKKLPTEIRNAFSNAFTRLLELYSPAAALAFEQGVRATLSKVIHSGEEHYLMERVSDVVEALVSRSLHPSEKQEEKSEPAAAGGKSSSSSSPAKRGRSPSPFSQEETAPKRQARPPAVAAVHPEVQAIRQHLAQLITAVAANASTHHVHERSAQLTPIAMLVGALVEGQESFDSLCNILAEDEEVGALSRYIQMYVRQNPILYALRSHPDFASAIQAQLGNGDLTGLQVELAAAFVSDEESDTEEGLSNREELEMLDATLTTQLAQYAPDHPEVLLTLENLGDLYAELDQREMASRLWGYAFERMGENSTLGAFSETTWFHLRDALWDFYKTQGQDQQADRIERRARVVLEERKKGRGVMQDALLSEDLFLLAGPTLSELLAEHAELKRKVIKEIHALDAWASSVLGESFPSSASLSSSSSPSASSARAASSASTPVVSAAAVAGGFFASRAVVPQREETAREKIKRSVGSVLKAMGEAFAGDPEASYAMTLSRWLYRRAQGGELVMEKDNCAFLELEMLQQYIAEKAPTLRNDLGLDPDFTRELAKQLIGRRWSEILPENASSAAAVTHQSAAG